jgi:hypothetical protein
MGVASVLQHNVTTAPVERATRKVGCGVDNGDSAATAVIAAPGCSPSSSELRFAIGAYRCDGNDLAGAGRLNVKLPAALNATLLEVGAGAIGAVALRCCSSNSHAEFAEQRSIRCGPKKSISWQGPIPDMEAAAELIVAATVNPARTLPEPVAQAAPDNAAEG